jgi:hypothetical protein
VPVTHTEPPPYYIEALQDAERLLKYAADKGIDIDPDVRDEVFQARNSRSLGVSDHTASNLLVALTKLSVRVRPVTAESLRDCDAQNYRHDVHLWMTVAICLVLVIVPCSVFSFVTSAIADAIRKDIVTANELAVKLTERLPPPQVQTDTSTVGTAANRGGDTRLPMDVITELQLFASTIRFVDARAARLNTWMGSPENDSFRSVRGRPDLMQAAFQLPVGLPNPPKIAGDFIAKYQDRRLFAQTLLDDLSYYYGAITSCVLPILYALLGTCAYLTRSFEAGVEAKTFTSSAANTNSARFLIAAIGGTVVGLFNNFGITQGASISPLAIAFLVGYAVDVFFAFLEGLVQAFSKTTNSPTQASGGRA